VSAGGAVLARLAPRVLGSSPAERMAAELARVPEAERAPAERNRLARELHDSVGHTLTVTTLQAGAAARVLDSDPAFVAPALDAIAEAGRGALEDLDHAIGLLRDGATGAHRAPQPDLADFDTLLAGARPTAVAVDVEVRGSMDAVARAVSREAFCVATWCVRGEREWPVAARLPPRGSEMMSQ
jgi:hypothetical protein